MSGTGTRHIDTREEMELGGRIDASSAISGRRSGASSEDRIGELETENARLHRLVAELLLKNQQLRRPV